MFRFSVWHPLARSGPGQTAFRRDDKPFWIRIKRLGYEQFACIRPVCVSSIYQVHTEFDGASEKFERVLLIRRPTPNALSGDTHLAKPELVVRQIATLCYNLVDSYFLCVILVIYVLFL